MLGRHGVDLRTAQELAGYSTPTLTAKYMHVRLHDVSEAVGKLPELMCPTARPNDAACSLRMTGTDADGATAVPPAVPPAVPDGYSRRHQSAPTGTNHVVEGYSGGVAETLEMERAGADSRRPASTGFSAPSRARTEDPLIKSRVVPRSKPLSNKLIPSDAAAGCSAGCSDRQGEGGPPPDPDLAALVVAWPSLPPYIRATVRALLATAAPTPPPDMGPSDGG